jgi:hypothetical protein
MRRTLHHQRRVLLVQQSACAWTNNARLPQGYRGFSAGLTSWRRERTQRKAEAVEFSAPYLCVVISPCTALAPHIPHHHPSVVTSFASACNSEAGVPLWFPTLGALLRCPAPNRLSNAEVGILRSFPILLVIGCCGTFVYLMLLISFNSAPWRDDTLPIGLQRRGRSSAIDQLQSESGIGEQRGAAAASLQEEQGCQDKRAACGGFRQREWRRG